MSKPSPCLKTLVFVTCKPLRLTVWGGKHSKHMYKCSTQVDFCCISSEPQAMLQSIELLHDAWPDHTVIQGHFRGHVRGVPRFVWRQPLPMEWPKLDVPAVAAVKPGSATASFRQFWQDVESALLQLAWPQVPMSRVGRQSRRWTGCLKAHITNLVEDSWYKRQRCFYRD